MYYLYIIFVFTDTSSTHEWMYMCIINQIATKIHCFLWFANQNTYKSAASICAAVITKTQVLSSSLIVHALNFEAGCMGFESCLYPSY